MTNAETLKSEINVLQQANERDKRKITIAERKIKHSRALLQLGEDTEIQNQKIKDYEKELVTLRQMIKERDVLIEAKRDAIEIYNEETEKLSADYDRKEREKITNEINELKKANIESAKNLIDALRLIFDKEKRLTTFGGTFDILQYINKPDLYIKRLESVLIALFNPNREQPENRALRLSGEVFQDKLKGI